MSWPLDGGLVKLVHHRLISLALRLDRCVQAAEARDGPIDQVPHVVLVANVCAEEFDFSAECAQPSREVLAGLLVATGDNDAVAFPRESKSRGASDSSQRAGNQNNVGAHAVSPPRYGQPERPAFKIAPGDGKVECPGAADKDFVGWESYPAGMGQAMELRHLRYFVAVAEERSLTLAAERRLHTSQPSLSRQIRDLEYEVGAQLMTRNARGVELTEAGRVFLDHARLALAQVEAAREAARRAAQPAKPSFCLGFLTGQEMDWLPEARPFSDRKPRRLIWCSS